MIRLLVLKKDEMLYLHPTTTSDRTVPEKHDIYRVFTLCDGQPVNVCASFDSYGYNCAFDTFGRYIYFHLFSKELQ